MGVPREKGNVLKNGWWLFDKNWLNFLCQFEEEVGSVGEQPASNKIDANKARRSQLITAPFFLLFSLMAKKNSPFVGEEHIPFYKINSVF